MHITFEGKKQNRPNSNKPKQAPTTTPIDAIFSQQNNTGTNADTLINPSLNIQSPLTNWLERAGAYNIANVKIKIKRPSSKQKIKTAEEEKKAEEIKQTNLETAELIESMTLDRTYKNAILRALRGEKRSDDRLYTYAFPIILEELNLEIKETEEAMAKGEISSECADEAESKEGKKQVIYLGELAYRTMPNAKTIKRIREKQYDFNMFSSFTSDEQLNTYMDLYESIEKHFPEVFTNCKTQEDEQLLQNTLEEATRKICERKYEKDDVILFFADENILLIDKLNILKSSMPINEVTTLTPKHLSKWNLNLYINLDKNTRRTFNNFFNKDITVKDLTDYDLNNDDNLNNNAISKQVEYIKKIIMLSKIYEKLTAADKMIFDRLADITIPVKHENNIFDFIDEETQRIDNMFYRATKIRLIGIKPEFHKKILTILEAVPQEQLRDMSNNEFDELLTLLTKCTEKINETNPPKRNKTKYFIQELQYLMTESNLTAKEKIKIIDNNIPIEDVNLALKQFTPKKFGFYTNMSEKEREAYKIFHNPKIEAKNFSEQNKYNLYITDLINFIKDYANLSTLHKEIFLDSIKYVQEKTSDTQAAIIENEIKRIKTYHRHINFSQQFKTLDEYKMYISTLNYLENIEIKPPYEKEKTFLAFYKNEVRDKRTLFPPQKISSDIDIEKLPTQISFSNKKFIILNDIERQELIDIIKDFIKNPVWVTQRYNEQGIKILGKIPNNMSGMENEINAEIKGELGGRIMLKINHLQQPAINMQIIGYAPDGLHITNLKNRYDAHRTERFFE